MSRNQFRLLVAAGWLLSMACLVVLAFESRTLPPELRDYLRAAGERSYGTGMTLLYTINFIAGVAATLGLLLFKRWARTLYVLSFVSGLLALPTLPPLVMTPWASLFSALAWFALSAMIVLMHLPPVREYFGRGTSDLR